jgi:hypothetical protein
MMVFVCIAIVFTFVSCNVKNDTNSSSVNSVLSSSATNITVNSALDLVGVKSMPTEAAAAILNQPIQTTLEKVKVLGSYNYDNDIEAALIIPKEIGSDIKIQKISSVNDKFVEGNILYEQKNIPDGYGLYLKAIRPEGSPSMKIVITTKGVSYEFILAYNGKDAKPDVEYITVKK